MKNYLKVPFAEKDEAKRLGARWDAARKLWYVQGLDLSPFARWAPSPALNDEAPKAAPVTAAKVQAIQAQAVSKGSRYFELDCDCLPWVGCAKCQTEVQARGWSSPA